MASIGWEMSRPTTESKCCRQRLAEPAHAAAEVQRVGPRRRQPELGQLLEHRGGLRAAGLAGSRRTSHRPLRCSGDTRTAHSGSASPSAVQSAATESRLIGFPASGPVSGDAGEFQSGPTSCQGMLLPGNVRLQRRAACAVGRLSEEQPCGGRALDRARTGHFPARAERAGQVRGSPGRGEGAADHSRPSTRRSSPAGRTSSSPTRIPANRNGDGQHHPHRAGRRGRRKQQGGRLRRVAVPDRR